MSTGPVPMRPPTDRIRRLMQDAFRDRILEKAFDRRPHRTRAESFVVAPPNQELHRLRRCFDGITQPSTTADPRRLGCRHSARPGFQTGGFSRRRPRSHPDFSVSHLSGSYRYVTLSVFPSDAFGTKVTVWTPTPYVRSKNLW